MPTGVYPHRFPRRFEQNCPTCGTRFLSAPSQKKRYCSQSCYDTRARDAKARFLTFVEVKESGCWEWSGWRDAEGYGRFWLNGRNVQCAQVSLALFSGETFDHGQQALHRCDNPPCVNPDHLFKGTQKQNIQDAITKGRHSSCRLKTQKEISPT